MLPDNLIGGQVSRERASGPPAGATSLLTRALQIGPDKDDVEWLHNSEVKRGW